VKKILLTLGLSELEFTGIIKACVNNETLTEEMN